MLAIIHQVNSIRKIHRFDQTCLVLILIHLVSGNYNINILYEGKHIAGSPFRAAIRADIDTRSIRCHGPGLDANGAYLYMSKSQSFPDNKTDFDFPLSTMNDFSSINIYFALPLFFSNCFTSEKRKQRRTKVNHTCLSYSSINYYSVDKYLDTLSYGYHSRSLIL